MFQRRHRQARVVAEPYIIDERFVVTRCKILAHFIVEAYCPIKRQRVFAPFHPPQIVNNVPVTNDEDALITQRCKLLANLVMKLRILDSVHARAEMKVPTWEILIFNFLLQWNFLEM